MPKNLPKHISRLLFLLVIFLLLALAAKSYLTDPSFYKYGHYRADAIPELAAGVPLYRGASYCKSCHDERQYDTSSGAHMSVQCEVCHGTSRGHPEDGNMLIPTDTIRLCSTCHESMPARPARQPQIEVGEHPSPEEGATPCHTCHDPHSPADDAPVTDQLNTKTQTGTAGEWSAGLSALISKCAKCHGKKGEGKRKNPALAGLESAVFIEKMKTFKSAGSEITKMTKYAKPLSEEDIVELAYYYEGLLVRVPEKPPE